MPCVSVSIHLGFLEEHVSASLGTALQGAPVNEVDHKGRTNIAFLCPFYITLFSMFFVSVSGSATTGT